ncbi:hypothetical protein ACFXAE_07090 [Streptomyces sp. NPDC059454]|uniref:hypothetical protein n=1 Tax=Streptomyces sp. NPDC059454 TaxID=3346836 RepID=UPI00369BE11E
MVSSSTEPAAEHRDCHDDDGCPPMILFGHPAFLRAYLETTAEANWSPELLAEFVLALADAGPLEVTDDIRGRVNACSDPEQLMAWASRAMQVTDADALFADRAG